MVTVKQEIHVPAGTYEIGLSCERAGELAGECGREGLKPEYLQNSCPRRKVFINEHFVSSSLVTFAEFEGFIAATGYRTDAEEEKWGWTWDNGWIKKEGLTWRSPFGSPLDERYRAMGVILPVLQASCNDAMAYAAWKGKAAGLDIRLPREEEWEAFSIIYRKETSLTDMDDGVRGIDDFFEIMTGIMESAFPRCPTGLIWEWTGSWFRGYSGEVKNREFGTTYRVLRGGSLMSSPVHKIKEYRFRRCPTARSPFYGFRTARFP